MKKGIISVLIIGLLAIATACSSTPTQGVGTVDSKVFFQSGKGIIYFDFDSSTIKSEYLTMLSDLANYLIKHKGCKLFIEGNTDHTGGADYNHDLGMMRATSIKKYLVKAGVNKRQISVDSQGEDNPIASNHDKMGRMKNRRGDITLKACNLPK